MPTNDKGDSDGSADRASESEGRLNTAEGGNDVEAPVAASSTSAGAACRVACAAATTIAGSELPSLARARVSSKDPSTASGTWLKDAGSCTAWCSSASEVKENVGCGGETGQTLSSDIEVIETETSAAGVESSASMVSGVDRSSSTASEATGGGTGGLMIRS